MEKVRFGEDVMSLLGAAVGIFPNLYHKDDRYMGKFLESHCGGHFLESFPPTPQFLYGGGLGLK